MVSWDKLAAPKEYCFAATTHLQLRSGETFIWAFDNMKNLNVVKAVMTGLNSNGYP